MKKFFSLVLTTAAVLTGAASQAQTFANSDLESWAVRNNIETPTNWLVTNDLLSLLPFTLPPVDNVTKTTDKTTGTYAAKLETVAVSVFGQSQPISAALILGNSFTFNGDLPGGMPFTGRPANLQFSYKLTGANALADSAGVTVQLTQTVNGQTTVVAEAGIAQMNPSAAYTQMVLPLQYQSTLQPDTVRLFFSSGNAEETTVGTTLFVDNISFTGGTVTMGTRSLLGQALAIAPNPTPAGRVRLLGEARQLAGALTLRDGLGRVVRQEPTLSTAPAERSLDLSGLPAGIYLVELSTAEGRASRKVVIE